MLFVRAIQQSSRVFLRYSYSSSPVENIISHARGYCVRVTSLSCAWFCYYTMFCTLIVRFSCFPTLVFSRSTCASKQSVHVASGRTDQVLWFVLCLRWSKFWAVNWNNGVNATQMCQKRSHEASFRYVGSLHHKGFISYPTGVVFPISHIYRFSWFCVPVNI